ncbi:MAG: bifunctional 4-hydroxy-2-oxoglutarate aldolase/2-dehydro-3-deoxy-phosphogluconate aldolase [Planctomycetaceae bacterium]|nr:bifunctional 4-hydroxy-2-oxoglutarate aldolase/2-dehydro-3-deoxy-phosphogluconate aldolase [Planctomycetaceae bacterium]MBQ2821041.1 bifunctional 4-hydroxy-2-oxoglutarate aldolase/2-dehydro-3-deoxy-phosphogluconate aldolase [Thermoguttaceae bacterium]
MRSQFSEEALQKIHACGAVAVLVIDEARNAVPTAKALLDGGISAIELTLRTPAALEALANIKRELPEMMAGVGTILTPEQVQQVAEAKAAFGVAPGLNENVVLAAQKVGLPFAPGIMTPSEIEKAVALGCRELKLFPAEPCGGMKYLKSIAAPYAHLGLKYLPLGGLALENIAPYVESPLLLALGGSWIAKRDMIQKQDWDGIRANAQATREKIDAIRGK